MKGNSEGQQSSSKLRELHNIQELQMDDDINSIESRDKKKSKNLLHEINKLGEEQNSR